MPSPQTPIESDSQSPHREVFVAALTVAALSLVVKLALALRDIVVARKFGATGQVDAFVLAYLGPTLPISIIAASFHVALVPRYIRVREADGDEAARSLYLACAAWGTLLLLVISLLFLVFPGQVLGVIGPGLHGARQVLAIRLMRIMLPSVCLAGLSTIYVSILNAHGRFAFPAAAAIGTPGIPLVLAFLLHGSFSLTVLAVGTAAGFLTETLALGWRMKREGLPVVPRFGPSHDQVREVGRKALPLFGGAFLLNGANAVDQSIASLVHVGGVAALNFAGKLVSFTQGIGVLAISAAVLPYFSRMIARHEWMSVRRSLNLYIALVGGASLLGTAALMFFSHSIVAIVFQGNAFTAVDTNTVSRLQVLLLIQVPFLLVGTLFVNVIGALRYTSVLMWGALASLVLDVVLDLAFLKWLGLEGVALSTSIVFVVSSGYLYLVLRRLLRRAELESQVPSGGG